jgi:hypothetical protein
MEKKFFNPSSSMVRTLISCIKNENSNFSSGYICTYIKILYIYIQ